MSKRSDLLKSVIKQNASEKPTFGTNPRDPWSTKANISEDAVLNKFLKSRGLNPITVTKDQKVAHSKMGEFLKWKRDHMFEETDEKDMVCFDIPLLIRVLEFTREEMSSDIELHNMVERLINMRHDVPLDMTHYDEITQKLVKENHIAIAMGKMLDDESGMVLTQIEELERGCAMIRSYIGKDYEKQLPAWVQAKITLATDYMSTVGNYLVSKNENVKEAHDPWQDKHFGPTKVIKQKYHVKTDTKSYNVKADNEEHAHKLVTKHAPGSKIVSIEHKGRMMEEVEQADESYNGPRGDKLIAVSHAAYDAGDKAKSKRAHTLAMKAGERYRSNPVNRDKAISHIMSGANSDYTSGKTRTNDSVEIDGTPIQEGSAAVRLAMALRKEREARELKDKSREAAEKNEKAKQPTQQQENTMDSLAATGAPNDCANTPDDVAPKDKNKKLIQMSKSARIIKSIYNRKNMKEETFDTEKEDKSVVTYGKKPKLSDNEKKIDAIGGKTQAAAIMTGGTTLTGTPRDTIEIDPMMQLKPGLMGQSGQAIKPKNNNR
jgi:hypothetical protein